MHRCTGKQYADKLLRYRLRRERACVYVYAYVYVRVHIHAHLSAQVFPSDVPLVYLVLCGTSEGKSCLLGVSARTVHKEAPRWSTADVYDRDLR